MKKIISLIVAMLMLVAIFAACGSEETPDTSTSTSDETVAGPFDDVEPLDEEVDIRVATLSGLNFGIIPYLIDELGGFEKANINFDGVGQVYGNGSTLIEAASSWDVGTSGLGGMMTGTISKGCIQTALTNKVDGGTFFWAQKDSAIAQAGISNIGGTKEMYGTAAEWKGQEIYYPKGTTLHYVLATALGKMGLTLEDVKSTQMDVASVNTALRAGTCQVGGTWGSLSFASDMTELFVPVVSAMDVGCPLPAAMYWNPTFYAEHYDAVVKFVELYFRAVDWIYENEDNARQFLDVWDAWNIDNGINVAPEVNAKYLIDAESRFYSLKESYDFFKQTVTASDGTSMTGYELQTYEPLNFLVSVGSFKEDSLATFLDDKCKGDAVIDVYENLFQGRDTYGSGIAWLDDFEY
ncbi:MAG: ABC transporter substrate-binding protein [Eubacteriales bacterium]